MKKKRVGIITMHRVMNAGSALQAYALQEKVRQLGYDVEIINYEFPYQRLSTIQRIVLWWKEFIKLFIKPHQYDVLYHRFRIKYLNTTKRLFTKENIQTNPPKYDVYMSGSDQIWNPRWTDGDTNFMLGFAPENAKKVAYSSSFTQKSIPDEFREQFARCLNRYDYLTVREESGIKIINDLIGKDITNVCDPTLLLNNDEYREIADCSLIKIDEPFILVYVLAYMNNPFPQVYNIVKRVKETLNCKVCYLSCNPEDSDCTDNIQIPDVAVSEFLWLFSHAKFAIVSSFHGAAFSIINHIPFFAIADKQNPADDRVSTLLKSVNQEYSMLSYDANPGANLILSNRIVSTEASIEPIRTHSLKCLKEMLSIEK